MSVERRVGKVVKVQADILLTREVLRKSGLAIPPVAAPCPDRSVDSSRLADGRLRVSLHGVIRDGALFPPPAPPADFTFTER